LKTRWNMATLNSTLMLSASTHSRTGPRNGVNITTKKMVAPTTLYKVWNVAVLRALREEPIAAIQEVKHVPMFAPTTKLRALGSGSNPDNDKNTTIDVTTDED